LVALVWAFGNDLVGKGPDWLALNATERSGVMLSAVFVTCSARCICTEASERLEEGNLLRGCKTTAQTGIFLSQDTNKHDA